MNSILKKLIFPVLTLAIVLLALTSCQNSNSISFGSNETNSNLVNPVNSSDGTNAITNKDSNLKEPVYKSTNYTLKENNITDKEEKKSELIVQDIVNACVAITATSATSSSRGSGVLFAYDNELGFSYIVTCFHVIESYSDLTVTLDDGTEYKAYLVGGYSDEDIAVLAIKATNLTYINILSDSDTLLRGMDVICIGNPLGKLPNSVSKGVISYVNRQVLANAYTTRTLLQTDVAINSGNSGGGLFAANGLLIGIVSNKYSDASIDNLGFAVPSKIVLSTIKELLNTARYDEANDLWNPGYIEGDYNFAFTISFGQKSTGMWSYINVVYVSNMTDNPTDTGYDSLQIYDIVNKITIKFKDSTKEAISYDLSTLESDTLTKIMLFLNNNVSVGDTLSFDITRNNTKTTIEFEVSQYKYIA